MSDCYSCEQVLSSNSGGIACIWKRYRKYLIGFLVGVLIILVFNRYKEGKK